MFLYTSLQCSGTCTHVAHVILLLYIICQLAHSANIAHALTVNLDQLGTPTTLSAADVIQNRAKQWGVLYTDGEVHALSFII